jgi:acetyl-CoA carboxylase biotin carboxyl carrier protein
MDLKSMDLKDIKRVIQMVEEAQISHFSIEVEGVKIEVKKEVMAPPQTQQTFTYTAPQALPAAVTAAAPQAAAETPRAEAAPKHDEKLISVKSQMVGTFYMSSKPGADPFIKIGDHVKPGQVVCIIEAMKLFNEIESEQEGIVEKICVENATPVEYGQELFLLRLL